MQFTTVAMSLVLLFTSLPLIFGAALVTRNGLQYNNYPTTEMVFNGTIAGISHTATGSIQEVYAKFFAAHSEVNATAVVESLSAKGAASAASASTADKRSKSTLYCLPITGWDWVYANGYRIEQGIWYLEGVSNSCQVNSRSCSRVSCSYDAAIYLCNDNYYNLALSCSYIASYANDISETCRDPNEIGFAQYPNTGGQEFDTDNYNVIVRYDNC